VAQVYRFGPFTLSTRGGAVCSATTGAGASTRATSWAACGPMRSVTGQPFRPLDVPEPPDCPDRCEDSRNKAGLTVDCETTASHAIRIGRHFATT